MENSVFVQIPIEEISETEEQPSKTYKLDLDAGRIVGYADGLEAVKQAIRKALITPRFKCLIYDDQYGSELKEAISQKDTGHDYIEAAVPGLIKDTLSQDSRILDASDFSFSFDGGSVEINFTVETIYGAVDITLTEEAV